MKHKNIKHKKDRKSFYMGIFIAFIMITSVFGVMFYGFTGPSTTVKYNDYKFRTTNLGYTTKIDGMEYHFSVLPQDVESINITGNIKDEILNAQAVIVTSDHNSTYNQEIAVASYNMNIILSDKGKFVANAFMSPNDQLPVITCLNASQGLPVMEIVESNQTTATLENNCISIMFDTNFNLERVTSKILYLLLGVIDE